MLLVGDHHFMSSVEIIERATTCNPACGGYDRTAGKGMGHLFELDEDGNLLRDIKLGELDTEPGFDACEFRVGQSRPELDPAETTKPFGRTLTEPGAF
ncbi:hypothetical protein [Actinocorallia populi]|uniref:hypothetical protein n=1 Tax=Actinocorallia populi TaxID=2079200 RepID=UPI000D094F23|nr:hypothetical protein [Actinocorallia populi]